MNTTASDNTFRRFLLGIASEEEKSLVEQAILAGEGGGSLLHDIEDQLIDDYVLGSFTLEEREGFTGHFMAADDRRRRVALAAALVDYARRHPAQAPSVKQQSAADRGITNLLSWRGTALLAAAASILLAALLGFEQLKLRREVQVASDTRNELTRLHDAMTPGGGESDLAATLTTASTMAPQPGTDQMPTLELTAPTRGVLPLLLRIPSQAQFVRFDAKLSLPLAARYREVFLASNGEQLWTQEFPASSLSPAQRSTIALPAFILSAGLYHFQIERASAAGHFELSEDHVFRVVRE